MMPSWFAVSSPSILSYPLSPERVLHDVRRLQAIPLLLPAGYVDCYRERHPTTPGYTYKLPTPALRLDYIFALPSLTKRLSACEIVTEAEAEVASDHFPIWAEFW